MYNKKNITYVLTILEAIEKILIYTERFETAEEFFESNDQLEFNACQTLLLVIGEEIKKIDEDLKNEHQSIPWRTISNFRNRIAHDYRGIDPNVNFDVIENYLDDLKIELAKMVDKIELDDGFLKHIVKTDHYRHLTYLIMNEEE